MREKFSHDAERYSEVGAFPFHSVMIGPFETEHA